MTPPLKTTRRALLRAACALTAAPALPSLAQSTEDYRALVCIYLAGGCDGHNVLVPQATAAYAAYRSIRGGLALPDELAGVLAHVLDVGAQALGPGHVGLQGPLDALDPDPLVPDRTERSQDRAEDFLEEHGACDSAPGSIPEFPLRDTSTGSAAGNKSRAGLRDDERPPRPRGSAPVTRGVGCGDDALGGAPSPASHLPPPGSLRKTLAYFGW